MPCPGCNRTRNADAGHHLCRECEGYAPAHTGDACPKCGLETDTDKCGPLYCPSCGWDSAPCPHSADLTPHRNIFGKA